MLGRFEAIKTTAFPTEYKTKCFKSLFLKLRVLSFLTMDGMLVHLIIIIIIIILIFIDLYCANINPEGIFICALH